MHIAVVNMAIIHAPRLHMLGVVLPSGLSTTLNNIMTAFQVIGGGTAGVILGIAAIQLMSGGRESVEMGKKRLTCLIIGMVLLAGCGVIKTFIDGLMAF